MDYTFTQHHFCFQTLKTKVVLGPTSYSNVYPASADTFAI